MAAAERQGLLARLKPELSTRQMISIFKGALAYTLAFVLIFIRKFNKLDEYPITLSGIVLVTIAGQPGRPLGACLDAGFWGALGVLLGAGGFAILAKLGHAHVAQGFVFAIFVYLLAIIKAQGLRYFGFSLLAIIMCFSGIYTSVLLGGQFSPKFLLAYMESYAWGFAIVFAVNILVFPTTSERELREIMVHSLEHINFFSHLIAKTYRLELTDEERKVRDSLNLSIRADYGFLTQKLSETSLEINWSKWSMEDYRKGVQQIRQMQQGLITSYSSLVVMEAYNPQALRFIKEQLSDESVARSFAKLRRGADLVIEDIVGELAVGKLDHHRLAGGSTTWEDFREDDESDTTLEVEQQSRGRSKSVVSTEKKGALLAKLRSEVENTTTTPMGSRAPSLSRGVNGEKASPDSSHSENEQPTFALPKLTEIKPLDRPAFLKKCWQEFEKNQSEAVSTILRKSMAGDELWLHRPGPSLHDTYQMPTGGTKAWDTKNFLPESTYKTAEATPLVVEDGGDRSRATDFVCGTAVMRTFSFLFGMGQLVNAMADLHEHIVASDSREPRKKRFRVHLFERTTKPDLKSKMCVREAVAVLNGREYHRPKVPLLAKVRRIERIARSNTSIFALKVAAAVSVYAVFILAPSLKQFFIDYRLTGGTITIVVAVNPVVGQSLFTWVLQILGTGLGSLYGMIVLMIFRHVGPFHFNPYGIVCFMALFSIPMSYLIYVRPMYFSGALLAMNGAGVIIVTEWVYREIPGQIRPAFDSPPLALGKALTAMALALGIGAIFQLFILRRPARRTLRKDLAKITYGLSSYAQLLTALNESIVPAEQSHLEKPIKPSAAAVQAVHQELTKREIGLQVGLLNLMPMYKFASLEPGFGLKFEGQTILQVIRAHQVILDRLREARVALMGPEFSEIVMKEFVEPLAPYRRQARKFNRVLFYLTSTSLDTKTPLPSDLPSMVTVSRALQHDAMVLSHRLTRAHGPHKQDSAFVRFWFFLVSFSSVAFQLERLEDLLRDLFTTDYDGDEGEHETPPE